MPKGHTEEQIVAAITAQEGGEATKEICRRMGISTATFYSWKKQYAASASASYGSCASFAKKTIS